MGSAVNLRDVWLSTSINSVPVDGYS
jgi:hypothetical protein